MTTYGYVGVGIGKILPAAQAKDPSYELVACTYPVTKRAKWHNSILFIRMLQLSLSAFLSLAAIMKKLLNGVTIFIVTKG